MLQVRLEVVYDNYSTNSQNSEVGEVFNMVFNTAPMVDEIIFIEGRKYRVISRYHKVLHLDEVSNFCIEIEKVSAQ
jgi:hypothetical protein